MWGVEGWDIDATQESSLIRDKPSWSLQNFWQKTFVKDPLLEKTR